MRMRLMQNHGYHADGKTPGDPLAGDVKTGSGIRRGIGWPVGLWFLNRCLLVLVAGCSLSFLPVRNDPGLWHAYPGNHLLNGWLRWDSGWYLTIARDGYIAPEAVIPGFQRNTAFFPLYPLLTRGIALVTPDHFIAGLLVSNLSFLLALLLLFDSVRQTHGERTARKTVALVLFHPCSLFFSAMYTESLFLLLAVMAFRAARDRHWLAAGIVAALASGTRVVGIAVTAGIGIAYLESIHFDFRRIRADALWIMTGVLGALGTMGFLAWRYGNPFEFAAAQDATGWTAGMGILPQGPMDVFQLAVLGVAAVLTIPAWRSESRAEAAWATIMLLFSCTRWPSMARLSLVIFPLYPVAARLLGNTKWFLATITVSALLLVILTVRFALWYWVA